MAIILSEPRVEQVRELQGSNSLCAIKLELNTNPLVCGDVDHCSQKSVVFGLSEETVDPALIPIEVAQQRVHVVHEEQ